MAKLVSKLGEDGKVAIRWDLPFLAFVQGVSCNATVALSIVLLLCAVSRKLMFFCAGVSGGQVGRLPLRTVVLCYSCQVG